MTALLIFISTFILVFALGFQSLNVNNGHKAAAFFTSFFISGSNLVLFKTVPQAGVLEIGAYLLAGPLAIVCSMCAHERWMNK
jgi:ABC-type Fe3+ transport system permease subunit